MDTTLEQHDIAPPVARDTAPVDNEASVELASQWRLMWWKFRKHRLAMVGLPTLESEDRHTFITSSL